MESKHPGLVTGLSSIFLNRSDFTYVEKLLHRPLRVREIKIIDERILHLIVNVRKLGTEKRKHNCVT